MSELVNISTERLDREVRVGFLDDARRRTYVPLDESALKALAPQWPDCLRRYGQSFSLFLASLQVTSVHADQIG